MRLNLLGMAFRCKQTGSDRIRVADSARPLRTMKHHFFEETDVYHPNEQIIDQLREAGTEGNLHAVRIYNWTPRWKASIRAWAESARDVCGLEREMGAMKVPGSLTAIRRGLHVHKRGNNEETRDVLRY